MTIHYCTSVTITYSTESNRPHYVITGITTVSFPQSSVTPITAGENRKVMRGERVESGGAVPSIDDDHFLARHAADGRADADGLSKPHHTDGDGDECSGAKSQETHNTEEEEEGRRYLNDSKNTSFPLCLYLALRFKNSRGDKRSRNLNVELIICAVI